MDDLITDAGERELWTLVVSAFRAARNVRGSDVLVRRRRDSANQRANALLEAFCFLTGQDDEAAYDTVAETLVAEHELALAEAGL